MLLSSVVIGLIVANIIGYFALSADSPWARLLDVNREKNFATAFSVLLLIGCALLLWQISTLRSGQLKDGRLRDRNSFVSHFVSHWRSLSLLFAGMAADEGLQLHEQVNKYLDDRFYTTGFFYYDWVIPGSLFVLAVGLVYARFLLHLTPVVRDRFLFSGILYISGALGMEMVSGYYIYHHGLANRAALALLNGVEESAEMFGLVAFIYALMDYSQRLQRRLTYKSRADSSSL